MGEQALCPAMQRTIKQAQLTWETHLALQPELSLHLPQNSSLFCKLDQFPVWLSASHKPLCSYTRESCSGGQVQVGGQEVGGVAMSPSYVVFTNTDKSTGIFIFHYLTCQFREQGKAMWQSTSHCKDLSTLSAGYHQCGLSSINTAGGALAAVGSNGYWSVHICTEISCLCLVCRPLIQGCKLFIY